MNDPIALGDEGAAALGGLRPAIAADGPGALGAPTLQPAVHDLAVTGPDGQTPAAGGISAAEPASAVAPDTLAVVVDGPAPAPGSGRVLVTAVLRGGPAAGRQVQVPRIAGSFPMFIGVAGANYVRDKGTWDSPVYNWWPAGASSPAGDPSARTDRR